MKESQWTKEVKAKVIARAWHDKNFRKLLTTDPRAALNEFGIKVPTDTKIKVIEAKQDEFYLLIPPPPAAVTKLSDKELEKLAAATYTTYGAGQSCDYCSNPSGNC
jgi:hypothetical protein